MLDRKKPFGEIFGVSENKGAKFIQDGKYFDAKGNSLEKPKPAPMGLNKNTPDYINMHHMRLKRLVENTGGTYVDKEQAAEWLKAHDVS